MSLRESPRAVQQLRLSQSTAKTGTSSRKEFVARCCKVSTRKHCIQLSSVPMERFVPLLARRSRLWRTLEALEA